MVPFLQKCSYHQIQVEEILLIGKNRVIAKKGPSTNLPNKSFLILYNLIMKKALHATNGVIDKKKK